MKVEVLHFRWSFEDDVFEGGEQTIEKPSKKLLAGVAAAAACPDPPLRVVSASKEERAVMANAVQSDADSQKVNDAAVRKGDWQVSNVHAQLAVYRARLKAHEESVKEGTLDGRMSERTLAYVEFAHEQTYDVLSRIEDGASFDEAAQGWHDERRAEAEHRARVGES